MGEKQDKVKKNNQEEKNNEGGGGGGPTIVVLKFDLHCEGCVKKIKHSLRKNFDGVETVKGDIGSNKLTIVGKVDPLKIKEKVEQKIKKKVELILSQQPNKEEGEKKVSEKKLTEENKSEVKSDVKKSDEKKDNKPKEPPVSTVVLKTRVHCDGCVQKIKKIIAKREGVKDVDVDLQKDTITIKGTVNMKELLPYLNVKLKRVVELAPPPKKDDGDKKAKEGGGNPPEKSKQGGSGAEKHKEGGDGGRSLPEKSKEGKGDVKKDGGEKKKEVEEKEKKSVDGRGDANFPQENTTRIEINKMEYGGNPYGGYGYGPGYGYNYTYDPRQYDEASTSHQVVQYWHEPGDSHPPQLFSDENPNACSVM